MTYPPDYFATLNPDTLPERIALNSGENLESRAAIQKYIATQQARVVEGKTGVIAKEKLAHLYNLLNTKNNESIYFAN